MEPLQDAVLTKKVLDASKKRAILKQIPTHFKAKREKGVGTPFPRVPAPIHPWTLNRWIFLRHWFSFATIKH